MFGLIGKAALVAGQTTLIGTVPQGGGTINARFANNGTVTANVTLWIGTGAGPTTDDLVTPGVAVQSKAPYEDTGIVAVQGEKVWARAETPGVTVRVHGQ